MKMHWGWIVGLMVCSIACGSSREETCRRAGLVYDTTMARCACPAGTTLLDAGCAASNEGDGGSTGEDACTAQTWFVDDDGDRFGVEATTIESCSRPEGYAAQAGDCDDANASIHPGQTEICDLIDDDCDVGVHGCPDSCRAEAFGSNLYLFCQDELTWEQAAAECESVSYRLVAVESAGENEWLASRAVDLHLSQAVWLGGWGRWTTDDADWRWPDGTLFWQGTIASGNSRPVGAVYANWVPYEEPSQDGPVSMSTETTSDRGRWINRPWLQSFICERSPAP